MRRSAHKRATNTTQIAQAPSQFDVEAEIDALKTRIARLEELHLNGDEDSFSTEGHPLPQKRRGRKRKHSSNIHQDRDMFVRFFEQHWPEIEPLCSPKPNPRSFRKFLLSHDAPLHGQMADVARQLLERIDSWEEFLSAPAYKARYRGDPRVLAGALAGVPVVGLWRSLKLCPPSACKLPIHERAMRSYLERKHPGVFERLAASPDLLHVTSWWQGFGTRDKRLRNQRAVDLVRWWSAGIPHYLS